MLVKICGITRLEDATAAVEAGAGAIGFIFWPGSPRIIDPYRARAIAASIPPFIATVGVFVDQPADYVSAVAGLVRLSAVQLHGHETAAYAATLARPIVKAVRVGNPGTSEQHDQWPASTILLVDTNDPVRHGGTGRLVNWPAAARIAARRKVLLAGGLTPENVAAAIDQVRPFGIDVSSGVERAPGVKDPARIKALFDAVKSSHFSDNHAWPSTRS